MLPSRITTNLFPSRTHAGRKRKEDSVVFLMKIGLSAQAVANIHKVTRNPDSEYHPEHLSAFLGWKAAINRLKVRDVLAHPDLKKGRHS